MPQPALHLLIGSQKLARWATTRCAPFDVHDPACVNAFLHGTLAPDLGNFPGGSRDLAHAVHTRRTADVVHALFAAAADPAGTAFAWGWLSHVLADAAIHPLVNDAAVRCSVDGTLSLVEHVRVEVGIDVWFCGDEAMLDGVRLEPAFRTRYPFLRDVLADTLRMPLGSKQLAHMERMMIVFSHAAVKFARGGARRLAWRREGPRPSLLAAALWHTATRVSSAESVVHAYLNPRLPGDTTVNAVHHALARVHQEFHQYERAGVADLPSWNLEDGSLTEPRSRRFAAPAAAN